NHKGTYRQRKPWCLRFLWLYASCMRLNWILSFLLFATAAFAAEHRDVGLTQKGTLIEAKVVEGSSSATVLMVGGLNGRDDTSRVVDQEVAAFEAMPQSRRQFRLIAIAVANPDSARLQFPPMGVAYRENAESHALWRWLGIHAPDQVLVIGN